MRIWIIVFFIFGLSITSCSKSPPTKGEEPATFDAEFVFVNGGDSTVVTVAIMGLVYYPQEDSTKIQKTSFAVQPIDTLSISIENCYEGCIGQLGIQVIWWEGDPYNGGIVHKPTYYSEQDTIQTEADAKWLFKWPEDSILMTE